MDRALRRRSVLEVERRWFAHLGMAAQALDTLSATVAAAVAAEGSMTGPCWTTGRRLNFSC
jgi:hypothetical protein